MNKKAESKNKNVIILVVIALVVIIGVYYFYTTTISLAQHAVPADITKSGSNSNGVAVSLYNCPQDILDKYKSQGYVPQEVLAQCAKVSIPTNFLVAGSIVESDLSGFSIVKRTSPQSCTTVANCYTFYNTNATASPNMQCYKSQCILGQVNTVNIGIGVINPSSSQITFTNVHPDLITPAIWNTSIGTQTPQTLAPNSGYTWNGAPLTSNWENATGNTVVFSSTVSGTNSYTGEINTVSDSVSLVFVTNPTGTLNVSIQAPI